MANDPTYSELIASGLTPQEAMQVLVGSTRGESKPKKDRNVLGEFGAGVALGGTQALTSLGEGLGIAGEFLLPEAIEAPATALKESSQQLERKAEEYFDPQGKAGGIGRITGRIAGEVAATVGTFGAGRAAAPASMVNAFRAWAGGSRIKSGAALAAAELPLSVPRALSYAEETGRPFSRELGLELLGGFTGGALFPGKEVVEQTVKAGKYGTLPFASGKRTPKQAGKTGLLKVGGKYRYYVQDEFEPLLETVTRLSGRESAKRLNGTLAQMQGSERAAMAHIMQTIRPWIQANKTELKNITDAAAIRTDFEIRKQAIEDLRKLKLKTPTLTGKELAANLEKIKIKEHFIDRGKMDIAYDDLEEMFKKVISDPVMKDKTDELRQFFADNINARSAAGILKPKEGKDILSARDYYAPFREDFSSRSVEQGQRLIGRTSRFKPKKGVDPLSRTKTGEGRIYQDPIEVLLRDTIDTYNDIAKHRAGAVFSQYVDEGGGELLGDAGTTIIKKIDEAAWEALPSQNKWRHRNPDGSFKYYEIGDQDLFHALTQEGQESADIAMRIAQRAADIKRKSITLLPDFHLAAIIRDWPIHAVQRAGQRGAATVVESALGAGAGAIAGAGLSEDDRLSGALTGALMGAGVGVLARPAAEIGSGFATSVRGQNLLNNSTSTVARIMETVGDEFGIGDPKLWKEYVEAGAMTAGQSYDNKNVYKLVQSMAPEERNSIVGFFGKGMRGVIDKLEFIGSAAENAPRVAMYKQLRNSGVDIPEAAWAAQDVTLPFARKGSLKFLKNISEITPFFNATLKGWDKTFRLFRGDPDKSRAPAIAQSMMAMGTAITAPTIALWKINKDNPEYWDRPLWEKNLFWLVPKPDGGFYRVPKPFELGYIMASIPERALDVAARKGAISSAAPEGSDEANEFATSILDFTKSAVTGTIPIPAAMQPVIEVATNRDLFRWKPIEPEYLKTRPVEQRYTVRTPMLARSIADVINYGGPLQISPLRVEAILNSLGGTTARRAMQLVDAVGAETGRLTPASRKTTDERIADVMGLARFNTQEYDIGEIEYQAYNILKRSSDITAQYNRMRTSGASKFIIKEYEQQHSDELKIARSLKSMYGQMRKLREERNEVLNNQRLTDEQRRKRLDDIKERGRTLGARAFVRIDRATG